MVRIVIFLFLVFPLVMAFASEGPSPLSKEISALIEKLGDEDYQRREEASRQLGEHLQTEHAGEVVSVLRANINHLELEISARIKILLRKHAPINWTVLLYKIYESPGKSSLFHPLLAFGMRYEKERAKLATLCAEERMLNKKKAASTEERISRKAEIHREVKKIVSKLLGDGKIEVDEIKACPEYSSFASTLVELQGRFLKIDFSSYGVLMSDPERKPIMSVSLAASDLFNPSQGSWLQVSPEAKPLTMVVWAFRYSGGNASEVEVYLGNHEFSYQLEKHLFTVVGDKSKGSIPPTFAYFRPRYHNHGNSYCLNAKGKLVQHSVPLP